MTSCNTGSGKPPSSTHASVKEYYGKVLQTSKDLKTSACTAGGRPHQRVQHLLSTVPKEVSDKFYGCGAPLPLGIEGLRVLDLGCGSGRDCYVSSALVGERGSVIGLDMTPSQLQVAVRHAEDFTRSLGHRRCNMRFVEGQIEYLDEAGIPDESVDLIISNCVVNLSPDKERVLREAYRVLAPGGELYFSDVYCDRRLPREVQADEVLWGECVAGALYTQDFKRMARAAGFTDVRTLASSPIDVNHSQLRKLLGPAKFQSLTLRLFKLPGLLETECEDYGHVIMYKGTIKGHEDEYRLDENHAFEAGRPYLACGNTAAMLGETQMSWLSTHFQVTGNRSVHYGQFPCQPEQPASSRTPAGVYAACAPGSCC